MLTQQTWTLCSAFSVADHEDYLFLNDATHEDGAGEYAIAKRLPDSTYLQVESVTFSWCTEAKALHCIREALAGHYDSTDFASAVRLHVEKPAEHGRCHLCA
jgi:hypothetical protein